ncbi:DUF2280 domain-containing protein [Sphingomonas sp.]|uniref:DUF2280 domain-containing protein n=1 Tax=Sphingomonas sp. TaxID=28214 RepID=UPI00307D44D3
MAKLNEEEKAFLVCQFACFLTSTQACRAFEQQFGRRIETRDADRYKVDGWAGRRKEKVEPMKKWRPLFEETRKAFLENAAAIPIANATYRLAQLQSMFESAMGVNAANARPNIPLAAQLLEQAAKESGGSFTNKREHEHKGKVKVEEERTPEETRGMLEQRIAAALEKFVGAGAQGAPSLN